MSSGVELVQYDAARRALEKATKIDEAKAIKDKVTALQTYARQRNDIEMEAWLSEIKIRAGIRIGKLSKELEKAYTGGRGKFGFPNVGKPKLQVLKAAGISKNAAYRYEMLAEIMKIMAINKSKLQTLTLFDLLGEGIKYEREG